jgi:hypothetical protein
MRTSGVSIPLPYVNPDPRARRGPVPHDAVRCSRCWKVLQCTGCGLYQKPTQLLPAEICRPTYSYGAPSPPEYNPDAQKEVSRESSKSPLGLYPADFQPRRSVNATRFIAPRPSFSCHLSIESFIAGRSFGIWDLSYFFILSVFMHLWDQFAGPDTGFHLTLLKPARLAYMYPSHSYKARRRGHRD